MGGLVDSLGKIVPDCVLNISLQNVAVYEEIVRHKTHRHKMNIPLILWLAYKIGIFFSTIWVVQQNLTVLDVNGSFTSANFARDFALS